MISPYTSPAAEIRATRERKNITAADLARIVGCEPSTIEAIETGAQEPDFALLVAILNALSDDVKFMHIPPGSMSKRELAAAAGVTPSMIEYLKRTILDASDFDVTVNERNCTQIVFFPSAIEKIQARNTKTGRPRTREPKPKRAVGRPKKIQ